MRIARRRTALLLPHILPQLRALPLGQTDGQTDGHGCGTVLIRITAYIGLRGPRNS